MRTYGCHNCDRAKYKQDGFIPNECGSCLVSNDTEDDVPTQWRPSNDLVNHPSHYKSENGLETINVIEAFTAGLEGIEATDTGNIIKYICRWKKKNGLQDLKKAQWYLNHLIKKVEEKENQ